MNLMDQSRAAGLGEPLSMENNDALYLRLIAGDEKAGDEMIEGNLALVVYRVDAYLRAAPQMAYYRDDLISAGLHGLCQVVERMKKKTPGANPKPTGWITKAIDLGISNHADEANTITVPRRTQTRARKAGTPIRPPRTVSDKALVSQIDSSFHEEIAATELQEEILACCQTEPERRIVTMRVEGYTDAEIGKALNCSAHCISSKRAKIQARFIERCPE